MKKLKVVKSQRMQNSLRSLIRLRIGREDFDDLKVNYDIFETIKHIDDFGNEYWKARELQVILENKAWRFYT